MVAQIRVIQGEVTLLSLSQGGGVLTVLGIPLGVWSSTLSLWVLGWW